MLLNNFCQLDDPGQGECSGPTHQNEGCLENWVVGVEHCCVHHHIAQIFQLEGDVVDQQKAEQPQYEVWVSFHQVVLECHVQQTSERPLSQLAVLQHQYYFEKQIPLIVTTQPQQEIGLHMQHHICIFKAVH